MNITLNQNSWHFKIYDAVVGSTPPKSLCPYFWTLVTIFLFSPVILIMWVLFKLISFIEWIKTKSPFKKKEDNRPYDVIAAEIIKKWDDKERKEREDHERWVKITIIGTKIFKWVILPLILIGSIYGVYVAGNKIGWVSFLTHIAIVFGFIALVIFWIFIIEKYGSNLFKPFRRHIRKINPLKWGITQIIGGMIYSTYKKTCPIITWEGGENNDEYGIN